MRVNPNDLSSLYFSNTKNAHHSLESDVYINPSVSVSKSSLHGRGLVATQDIPSGTCLFVTPPVVAVDAEELFSRFDDLNMLSQDRRKGRQIEDISHRILLEATRREVNAKTAVGRSILCLVGDEDSEEDPLLSKLRSTSIAILTAKKTPAEHKRSLNQDDPWESIVDPEQCFSDSFFESVIRRNAFGPDFISYDRLEQEYPCIRPFHLLGIYPLAAMINHSYVSNAVRSYARDIMIVHSSQAIHAGEEILWSYVPPIEPQRHEILSAFHGISCTGEESIVLNTAIQKIALDYRIQRLLSNYNKRVVALESLSMSQREEIRELVLALEELFRSAPSAQLTSAEKRFLRLSWAYVYLHYLNAFPVTKDNDSITMRLNLLTHLHLAFCVNHNASTEHLSILHLAYELAGIQHLQSNNGDSSQTLPKFQFWTRQLQIAHQVRYGLMGTNVTNVKIALQHTQGILRRRDGYKEAKYKFL